jgi:DNA-3-methyladenine glycosylase II
VGSAPPARPQLRPSYAQATEILAARDPVLAALIERAGPMRLRRSKLSHFGALVQAIVFQQLAGAAARAIYGRLIAAMDGTAEPERVLALSDQTMRAVGLSAAKVLSLRDLATKVLGGTVVLSSRRLARVPDEEIIRRLSTVRGIGPWSAQMFLIFQLKRLDVWPVGDLGIRQGYGLAWKIPIPSARELEPLGEPFRPYRTVLAYYCWRSSAIYGGSKDIELRR